MVERLCILSEVNIITSFDVQRLLDIKEQQARQIKIEHHQNELDESDFDKQFTSKSIQGLFSDYNKQQVFNALKKTNGNKTATARLLGISRGKLYRLLQEQ